MFDFQTVRQTRNRKELSKERAKQDRYGRHLSAGGRHRDRVASVERLAVAEVPVAEAQHQPEVAAPRDLLLTARPVLVPQIPFCAAALNHCKTQVVRLCRLGFVNFSHTLCRRPDEHFSVMGVSERLWSHFTYATHPK